MARLHECVGVSSTPRLVLENINKTTTEQLVLTPSVFLFWRACSSGRVPVSGGIYSLPVLFVWFLPETSALLFYHLSLKLRLTAQTSVPAAVLNSNFISVQV